MRYNVKAVQTKYNNRIFRSRLEATWAALFDLLDWDWEYEPFDLDGWFPDFIVSNKKHGKGELLIEVKPYILGEDLKDPDHKETKEKIKKCTDKECLLVGISPFDHDLDCCLGHFVNSEWNGDDYCILSYLTKMEENTTYKPIKNQYDVFSHYGSYQFRLSGEYDGDHHLHAVFYSAINHKWGKAKEMTRYK